MPNKADGCCEGCVGAVVYGELIGNFKHLDAFGNPNEHLNTFAYTQSTFLKYEN